jgi:hypothetical protein
VVALVEQKRGNKSFFSEKKQSEKYIEKYKKKSC